MKSAPPNSIQQYLEALREALQGADPALAHDALYDAEEHLRAELAQRPGLDEAAMLAQVASSYGDPQEVADAYRASERKVEAALRTPAPQARASGLGRFFGVYADTRTWLSLLYLLLALLTGVAYFSFATIGLSLSVGLAVLIIGVPFFLLFIGATRTIALLEGRLVEALLGTRMPRRPRYPEQTVSWMQRIVAMLKDPRTWGTLLYLLLMLPLGVIYFTFATVGVVTSLALVVAPLVLLGYHAGVVQLDDVIVSGPNHPALLPLVAIAGVLLLTVTLHLARGIGQLHGQLAKALLVSSGSD
jgi:uncharacterized membrane protein